MDIHIKVILVVVVSTASIFLLQRIAHMQFWGFSRKCLFGKHKWEYKRMAERIMNRGGELVPVTRTVFRCKNCTKKKVDILYKDTGIVQKTIS